MVVKGRQRIRRVLRREGPRERSPGFSLVVSCLTIRGRDHGRICKSCARRKLKEHPSWLADANRGK
jgi:hypothetical protein